MKIKKISILIMVICHLGLAQSACIVSDDGKTRTCTNETIYTDNSQYENLIINNNAAGSLEPLSGWGLYTANLFGDGRYYNNVDITVSGRQADGIINRHSSANAAPTIINKLRIVATGLSGDGINFGEENSARPMTIGDDAYISSRAGSGVRINLALNAGVTNRISFGNGLTVITEGSSTHSEDVTGYGLFAGIRDRVCGDYGTNTLRCSLGMAQWRDTPNQGNAEITIGNQSSISTSGSGAHAVYAMRGGDIALGSTTIATGKTNAYGIYAETLKDRGGQVYLLDSVKITVPQTGYAIKADGEGSFVASKTRADTNGASIATGGVFEIIGNISASNGGTIDLIAFNRSSFEGDLIASDSGITALNINGTSAFIGNVSATNNGMIDLKLNDTTILRGDIESLANSSVELAINGSSSFMGKASKDDTGVIDFNLSGSDANWYITENSIVTTLNAANAGNVYLYGKNDEVASNLASYTGSQLITNNLVGNGVFWFKSNIERSITDSLIVENDVKGKHRVEVQNDGSQNTDGTEVLAIINTSATTSDSAFYANRYVELGGYAYKFTRNQDNLAEWILSMDHSLNPKNPPKVITSTGNAAASSMMSTYLVNFIETQSLLKRMGELTNNTSSSGLWGRMYAGDLSAFSGNLLSGFKMKYHAIQIGADYSAPLDNANLHVGGAVSYLDGSPKHNYTGVIGTTNDKLPKVGTGKSDGTIKSYSAALYGIYKSNNHLYLDGLIKYSYMKNTFSVSDSAGLSVSANSNSHAISLSAEIGQRFYFDELSQTGGYITPQLQIAYGNISSARYKATNGLVVKIDKRNSILGRVGTELGYHFKDDKDITGNIFTKISYLREFTSDGTYWLNQSREKYSFKGNWYQMEIGANIEVNKNHHVYGNLEFNKGNKFDQKQINLGYRYNF